MGKIKKGVLGGYSGVISNIVGYRRNNKDIIQKKPVFQDTTEATKRLNRAISMKYIDLFLSFWFSALKDSFYKEALEYGDGVRGRQLLAKAIMEKTGKDTLWGLNRNGLNFPYFDADIVSFERQTGSLKIRINDFTNSFLQAGMNAFRFSFFAKDGVLITRINAVYIEKGQVIDIFLPQYIALYPNILVIQPFDSVNSQVLNTYLYYYKSPFFKPSLLV